MDFIDKELKAYNEQLPELLKTLKGKWIAMRDGSILCSDDNMSVVIDVAAEKGHEPGDYLLKQVKPKDEEEIQRFYSRVFVQ